MTNRPWIKTYVTALFEFESEFIIFGNHKVESYSHKHNNITTIHTMKNTHIYTYIHTYIHI